jgi:ribosomal protein S18 acetylase RimI-like enzyme
MLVRQIKHEELGFAAECARAEGWCGETEQVFRTFFELDPEGCSIAEVDGSPVGLCVAVSYGMCGFLGELIVLKEFRGRGLGRKLMEHGMRYLRNKGCISICLDGDEPATALYEKLGFEHFCKSLRFVGSIEGRESSRVRSMTRDDLQEIAAIDLEAFGADRLRYLVRRFELFPQLCKTIALGNRAAGYIMAQPGIGVTSVGPWVMTVSAESSEELLESIASAAGDSWLRIGVLESNASAVTLLRSIGNLEETTPSFRMIFGQKTRVGISSQLYAIGSAAKG